VLNLALLTHTASASDERARDGGNHCNTYPQLVLGESHGGQEGEHGHNGGLFEKHGGRCGLQLLEELCVRM